MDRYFYLILCLYVLLIWLIILCLRPDLKKELILTSIFGGIAGLLAELWYFKDYWRPKGIFLNQPFIEDFIVGFCIAGIASTVFDVVFGMRNIKKNAHQYVLSVELFIIGVTGLILFSNLFTLNSEILSIAEFLFFASIIVYKRVDLIRSAFFSGLLTMLIIFPVYFISLNWITPNFFKNVWLLNNTVWGITVFGNIPLTELLWYWGWGSLAGVLYEFSSGKVKRQLI